MNSRLRHRLIVGVLIALAAFSLPSCEVPETSASHPTLRVGLAPWPGFDVIHYAEAAGLFEQRGVQVELIRLDNQFDATRALHRGRVDVCFSSVSDVMQQPGAGLTVILITNISHGSDGIVARPGIENVRDLKDATVSAKLRTVNQLILAEAADANGLKVADMRVEDISNNVAYERFIEGKLDAAVLWEPLLSRAAEKIGGTVIFRTSDVESVVIDALLTQEETVQEKSEAIHNFLLAWFDIMAAIDSVPGEVFAAVEDAIGQPSGTFRSDYAGLRKGDPDLNRSLILNRKLDNRLPRIRKMLDLDSPTDVTFSEAPLRRALEEWERQ